MAADDINDFERMKDSRLSICFFNIRSDELPVEYVFNATDLGIVGFGGCRINIILNEAVPVDLWI